jgi:hypothetical protein
MSTVACADRAIAMCRAPLKVDSISTIAPRMWILSSNSLAHGMAMADSTPSTQIVMVSSTMVNARRISAYPSAGLTG